MSNAFSRTVSTDPKIKRFDTLTPNQAGVLDSLAGYVKSNVGVGAVPYGGRIAAGASPLQANAFSAVGSYATDPRAIARGGAIDDMLAGRPAWQQIAADPYVDEYMTAIEAPTLRMFNSRLVPQILEQYGAGGPAGAVYDQLGSASADLATNLAAGRAGFVNENLMRAADARHAAIGLSEREQLMPIQLAGMFGDVQRGIESDELADAYGRWEAMQPYNNPAMGFLGSVLGTKAFDTWHRPGTKREEPTLLASILKGLSPGGMIQGLMG